MSSHARRTQTTGCACVLRFRAFLFCCLLLLTVAVVCTSCTARRVVEEYGQRETETTEPTEAEPVYPDRMRLDARIEFASHVVMVRVTGVDDIDIRQIRRIGEEEAQTVLEFRYYVELLDVLMDIPGTMQKGESTVVTVMSGRLPANDALDILEHKPNRTECGVLTGAPYAETDDVVSCYYDTPPMEIGGTYLMLLYEDTYASPAPTDVGGGFLWECDGDRVYHTRDRILHPLTVDALLADVQTVIDGRMGIFDEYRYSDTFDEKLAEKQMAADRNAE